MYHRAMASGKAAATAAAPAPAGKAAAAAKAPPAAASWPEAAVYAAFLLYLIVTLGPALARDIADICAEHGCGAGLRPSPWIDGKIDLSDAQWRDFRGNLPLLTAGAVLFLVLRWAGPWQSPRARLRFYAFTSFLLLGAAAGAYAVFALALVLGNYWLGRWAGRSPAAPWLTWGYTAAVLLASDWYHAQWTFTELLGPSFAPLDAWRGIYGWHRGMNLVALRMISFNMDRYWSLCAAAAPSPKDAAGTPKGSGKSSAADSPAAAGPAEREYEARVRAPLPPAYYDLVSYIAYVFYVPLHLAGPILPANAFLSQVHDPPPRPRAKTLLWLLARLVFALALMEFMLHYMYTYAIATSGAYRGHFGPLQIGLLGYFSLHTIWLKFLIIWRFFRLWALADNIETVENMNRCMSNNYSLQGFWRSWHRSFNRWLVRYIYVPLGGSKRRVLSTFAVFTFTAIWHDLQLQLLAWGWLIAIFIIPETVVTAYFNRPSMAGLRAHWSYRHLAAFGGALDIFFMMVVNLIGFSVGLEGIQEYLTTAFFSRESAWFLFGTLVTFFAATQVMFSVRAYEARRNMIKEF